MFFKQLLDFDLCIAVRKRIYRIFFEGGATLVLSGISIEEYPMATMVFNRRYKFGISCVHCKEELIAPDKSEFRAGTHIRHLWHCPNCSARFESIEQIPVELMTTDDIFPSLHVA